MYSLSGSRKGNGLEQDRSHDGEERCCCANSQCNHQYRDQRESRGTCERSNSITQISKNLFSPAPGPRFPGGISKQRWISERTKRCNTRLCRVHTVADIFPRFAGRYGTATLYSASQFLTGDETTINVDIRNCSSQRISTSAFRDLPQSN